jgi:hypothetical protein
MHCIHVLDRSTDKIYESIIEFLSRYNKKIETCTDISRSFPERYIGVFALAPRWVSVREKLSTSAALAAHFAHQLKTFSIIITVKDPRVWGFTAYFENERTGDYEWELPPEYHETCQHQMATYEEQRLQQLGVKGLDIIKKRGTQRPSRAGFSDPGLERRYRSRISSGELDLQAPQLQPGLSRLLHKCTGMSTAARLKKILQTPHVSIPGAAGEFSLALGLPNWIDECTLENAGSHVKTGDGFLYRIIEK